MRSSFCCFFRFLRLDNLGVGRTSSSSSLTADAPKDVVGPVGSGVGGRLFLGIPEAGAEISDEVPGASRTLRLFAGLAPSNRTVAARSRTELLMSEGAGDEVGRGSKVSLVCLLDERGMVAVMQDDFNGKERYWSSAWRSVKMNCKYALDLCSTISDACSRNAACRATLQCESLFFETSREDATRAEVASLNREN